MHILSHQQILLISHEIPICLIWFYHFWWSKSNLVPSTMDRLARRCRRRLRAMCRALDGRPIWEIHPELTMEIWMLTMNQWGNQLKQWFFEEISMIFEEISMVSIHVFENFETMKFWGKKQKSTHKTRDLTRRNWDFSHILRMVTTKD